MWHFSLLGTLFALTPWFLAPQEEGGTQERAPARVIHQADKAIYGMVCDAKGETAYLQMLGELRAVSIESGEALWSARLAQRVGLQDPDQAQNSSMAVTKEWVLVGFSDVLPMAECIAIDKGEKVRDFVAATGNKTEVTTVVADPKGKWVWLGLARGVMSRVTPKDIQAWSNRVMNNEGVSCAVIDPKGKKIAVGGEDGSVRFLDHSGASVDKKKVFEGREGAVSALAWGSKGKSLFVGTHKGTLARIAASNVKVKWQVQASEGRIHALAVHPKGDWVAVGDKQGRVRLFDGKTGERVASWTHPEARAGIRGLAVLDKGTQILSAAGASLQVWAFEE